MAACLRVLRLEGRANDVQQDAFLVTPIPGGTTEKYQLEVILKLQLIALNPDEATLYINQGAPAIDVSAWDDTTYKNW